VKNIPCFLSDFLINSLTLNYFYIKKIIRKEMPKLQSLSILDIGCGTGTLTQLFDNKKYLGFDIDKKAIFYAREKFPEYKFKVGDATAIKIAEKFDRVLVFGVLHHLTDKEVKKTVIKIYSLLKKNGRALIIEPVPAIIPFNILGIVLRKLDKGDYIRKISDYSRLLERKLVLEKKYLQKGVILDYAVFVAHF